MRGEEGGGMRGEEGGGMRGGSADHRTIIAGDEDTSRARNQNPVVEIAWSPSALPSLETRVGDERAGAGDASASARRRDSNARGWTTTIRASAIHPTKGLLRRWKRRGSRRRSPVETSSRR